MNRIAKLWAFRVVLGLVVLCLVEAVLCVLFFQQTSDHPLAAVHYGRELRKALAPELFDLASIGIWKRDAEYGYAHVPNASGIHWAQDYRVTYTIDDAGARRGPAPAAARGRVCFLGGSCTFGQGVNDDEAYPHILATSLWKTRRVVNRAVVGWGTSHAYLALSGELERDTPPDLVVYAMIPHHIDRNYVRAAWVQGVAHYGMAHPHFELVDARPVFQGVVDAPPAVLDDAECRRRELALTNAFLEAMHAKCRERDVAFVVVMLPHMVDPWPPAVVRALVEHGIPALDLSEMELGRFANDAHPNAADHRRLAAAIAGSFISDLLE